MDEQKINMDVRNLKEDVEVIELQTKRRTYHNISILEN